MQAMKATITASSEITGWARLVWLEAPEIARQARPGQFVMVDCGPDTTLRRPLSIHRIDQNTGCVALLFTIVGKGTAWLAERETGETVEVLGPLGNGFTLPEQGSQILLVAGGIGIAPLVFLAEEAIGQGSETTLVMGARNDKCLLPGERLPQGLKQVIHTTEDGSEGFEGIITAAWSAVQLKYTQLQNIQHIFACGPFPMYKSIRELAPFQSRNVQISLETRMACGVGACYGCTVPTRQGLKRVCNDGPVFSLTNILWEDVIIQDI